MNFFFLNQLFFSRILQLLFLAAFFVQTEQATAQVIEGRFPGLAEQQIQLEGFAGTETYLIAQTQAGPDGFFTFSFANKDYGAALLRSFDKKTFLLILAHENIKLSGNNFQSPEKIEIAEGRQNQLFARYAGEHPRREQTLSAWIFLERIYRSDPLFANQISVASSIKQEQLRIEREDSLFLASLPPDGFLFWYLKTRKLLASVSTVARQKTSEIPATVKAFRALNYADPKWMKSGLLSESLESHFWLLENSGKSLDSVYAAMKTSIDIIIASVSGQKEAMNEVSGFLFDLLERHSLFQASEYLALKVLNDRSCSLEPDLSKQLELYRAMKKGNVAPDFSFPKTLFASDAGTAKIKKLSDLKRRYTLVAFGASWCPKCTEEFPVIANRYNAWKQQGVEVVFVSLDDDTAAFRKFAYPFPFISTCDFLKWKSPLADAYYVFATPTWFLLDSKREIVLRPNSVKQVDAWIEWYLVKGNK